MKETHCRNERTNEGEKTRPCIRVSKKEREEEVRERRRTNEPLALRTGYNCLTLKKMGCVRGGGGRTDGRTRAREQDRKGLEEQAEEMVAAGTRGGELELEEEGRGSLGYERRAR